MNFRELAAFSLILRIQPSAGSFRLEKQLLQSTGRFWVGLNGTIVSIPHSEHLTRVSVRRLPP